MLKFGVCLCDGIWTYYQFLSQCPDPWQLISVDKGAGLCCVTDLLHQLKIERLARCGIEFEEHSDQLYRCKGTEEQ